MQLAGGAALTALCAGDGGAEVAFTAGGLHAVVEGMKQCTGERELQLSGLALLAIVQEEHPEISDELFGAGGCAALSAAMQAHPEVCADRAHSTGY
jgi:hypothetical protein